MSLYSMYQQITGYIVLLNRFQQPKTDNPLQNWVQTLTLPIVKAQRKDFNSEKPIQTVKCSMVDKISQELFALCVYV